MSKYRREKRASDKIWLVYSLIYYNLTYILVYLFEFLKVQLWFVYLYI